MKNIRKSIWLFLVILPFIAFSQGNGNRDIDPDAKRKYDKAVEYLFRKDFESAEILLKKAIKKDSSYIEAYMELAGVYYKTRNHEGRRKALKQVIRIDPDFTNPYYNLAMDYFQTGEYKASLPYFEKFLEFKGISKRYQELAKQNKEKAKFRAIQIANPVPYNPKNVGKGVNTELAEYWPAMAADRETLFFTRRLVRDKDERGLFRYNEDVFISNREGNKWGEAKRPPGLLNSKQYNEGAIAIAPHGDYLIFTGCQWPDTRGRCDLYISRKVNGQWTQPKNLGAPVNTPAKETQPSISFNGQTIYFASDRGGSRGNLDIWKSHRKEDGSWSKPENLGKKINTNRTEQSPFIHSDNKTLYFSSEGHMGMGKSDLFYSKKDSAGEFREPKNMGYPINDKGKDIGLFVSSNGKTAYFASKKDEGYGGLDIYRFTLYEEARPQPVTYVKGKIEDALTSQNLQANVKLKDLEDGDVAVNTQSDKKTGEFLVPLHSDKNYGLHVTKDGYIFHSEHLPIKSYDSARPFYLDVKLEPIREGKKAILNNIFFEFDSHKLKAESKADLQELIEFMKANPRIVIEIQGHTDNKGSDSYNQKLSQKRAKSVYDYLINEGNIAKNRLEYKGFGEAQPIATNKTEEGRAKNRRTEFKIIKIRK